MKQKEIKLVVEFTEGYQKRYTEACCRRLERLKGWPTELQAASTETEGERAAGIQTAAV